MKVLMLSWEYPPHMVGGLGQHVYDISRYLVRQGMEVHIITPRVKNYPDQDTFAGVFIHRVGNPISEASPDDFKGWTFTFNSEAIREAVRLNSEAGIDLIHAHDWMVAYAGRSISKIFGIPLVTTIHATEYGRNIGLHNRTQREINEIEKNLALEAHQIICCSQYMQDEISSLFGVHRSGIKIIPNGVEPEQFKELPEHPPVEFDPQEKALVFLGRLVPEKGVWQLLNCFPRVLESVPEAKLYIGGRGPQKRILEQRSQKLGIAEQVIFTGFLKEKDRNYVYHHAKAAVFPSLYEPFGIVALEAMATNTPVIVSEVGGLSEIVEHRQTGLKVPPGHESKLAEAIIELLTNTEYARQFAKNAAQAIASTYSWETIAHSTIAVYEEVIARMGVKTSGHSDVG
ncbi:MAG TPA: glycosyltransferase family 4 protein [Syntrophomonas sp.]|nr:glycosyltransferase family 4 protein [Syntrophomonas sp.]